MDVREISLLLLLSVQVSKVRPFLFVKSDTKIIIRSNNISNRLKVHIWWESMFGTAVTSVRGSHHEVLPGLRGENTADTLAMYYCNCVDNDKKKPGPEKDYYGYSYNERPLLWSVGRDRAGEQNWNRVLRRDVTGARGGGESSEQSDVINRDTDNSISPHNCTPP